MEFRPTGSVLAISATLVVLVFSGCTGFGPGNDDEGGEGSVAFYVTDAPADDFTSVYVTFDEVQVHRSGAGDDDGLSTVPDDDLSTVPDDDLSTVPGNGLSTVPDDTLDDDGAGWFTIVDSTQTIDLKQFQGDARAFLGDHAVDAGTYTQIRIEVSDVYGELADGTRVDFDLPSDTLKIVRPWTVADDEETVLIVDFDLDKSIVRSGNGEYRLKPVLKLTVETGAPESTDEGEATDATNEAAGGKPDKSKPTNTRRP